MEWNNGQSGSGLAVDGSTTNTGHCDLLVGRHVCLRSRWLHETLRVTTHRCWWNLLVCVLDANHIRYENKTGKSVVICHRHECVSLSVKYLKDVLVCARPLWWLLNYPRTCWPSLFNETTTTKKMATSFSILCTYSLQCDRHVIKCNCQYPPWLA